MKYIVCNSETSVYNRMYDELERFLEDGSVISLPEQIATTQFAKRMVDDSNSGKYSYKHVIILGQREFSDIDIEEDFGLYRYMKRELFRKLDINYKNIFYPQCLDSTEEERFLQDYNLVLDDNLVDVAIVILSSEGTILDYKYVTEENENLHFLKITEEDKRLFEKSEVSIKGDKLISIGYNDLLKARNLFLVVVGSDKRKYTENIFENNEEDGSILSKLVSHKNITIFADKEASYKSEEEINKIIKRKKKVQGIKENKLES